MKIVGLITEFNPLHNGHSYYIQKAKEITGADYCIVVMSGNYVQRGEPSIFAKELRIKAALLNGADLVLELPVCFSTGSAEYFASAAVSILDQLGVVTHLAFGSEAGDITLLKAIADILVKEPFPYRDGLQRALKEGLSYPSARAKALSSYINLEKDMITCVSEDSIKALATPNNILGIEYCKALSIQASSIIPVTISRKGAGYHDQLLQDNTYSSASALRNIFHFQRDTAILKSTCPENCFSMYETALAKNQMLFADDYSPLLLTAVLSYPSSKLRIYQDISPDLADKIHKNRFQFYSYSNACELLKSKDLTYSRISRSLLHIILDIQSDFTSALCQHRYCSYARMMGFRKNASPLLSQIKQHTSIPLITKLPDAAKSLDELSLQALNQTIYANQLYNSMIGYKTKEAPINEYTTQIIRL